MGTRICIMNHGRIVQVGQPLEVYRNPADTFVASFIGSPPMNLIKGEIGSESGRLVARFAGGTLSLPGYAEQDVAALMDRQVILGFRPEDIRVAPPDAANAARYAPIESCAVAAEPLGAETLVVVSLADDGEELVARVGRDVRVTSGQPLSVFFDLAQAHLFDPRTTRALPKTGRA